MKRFDMELEHGPYYTGEGESYTISPYESTNGDWVKWDDVQELIQTLKQTRDLVEGLCEEYRDYRGLRDLEKIDKFLNNIEEQGQ